MGADRQSSLRALAPASLFAFAVVLLIVVVASVSGGDDNPAKQAGGVRTTEKKNGNRAAGTRGRVRQRRSYTVRPGDNLATIAEQTGVSLEELRALNPTLDPQGLVSGQRVRLPAPSQSP